MSPYRTSAAVKSLLLKFANLYNPTWLSEQGAARSIEEFAERMGLGEEFTTRWAQEWVSSIGIGEKWMGEIMEGSTRCNVG
jgi:prenylcysteine oxidase/farnesylcysteine lyase